MSSIHVHLVIKFHVSPADYFCAVYCNVLHDPKPTVWLSSLQGTLVSGIQDLDLEFYPPRNLYFFLFVSINSIFPRHVVLPSVNRFPSFSMTKSLRSKRWWLFPDMPCSEMEYKNRHFKLLHCRANPKTSASYAPHEGQIGLLNLTGALVSERTHRTCQAGREHDWQLWLNRSRPKWSCRNLTQTNDTER